MSDTRNTEKHAVTMYGSSDEGTTMLHKDISQDYANWALENMQEGYTPLHSWSGSEDVVYMLSIVRYDAQIPDIMVVFSSLPEAKVAGEKLVRHTLRGKADPDRTDPRIELFADIMSANGWVRVVSRSTLGNSDSNLSYSRDMVEHVLAWETSTDDERFSPDNIFHIVTISEMPLEDASTINFELLKARR